ncbi:MAG: altronate dehydratase [Rhodobacteraceae bacterium]|nr:altronate dehydratase [Paracoccaceae bacterium]
MQISSPSFVRLNQADNVVIATQALAPGMDLDGIAVQNPVPSGHKLATCAISKGDAVRKYGQVIGFASADIAPGSHVHSHNLEFSAVDLDYRIGVDANPVDYMPEDQRATFQGYHRANGKVGTRNFIAVLTSVNCSATAAHMIAQGISDAELAKFENVDGVAAFSHGTGCGMATNSEGFGNLQRVLWGYARNPNVGGVLFVGLGCEVNQIDFLLEAYGLKQGPRVRSMNIQTMGGLRQTVEAGIAQVREMLPVVNADQRTPAPASELTLALQCGGSDGWSGVTANPALGYASDLLVRQGGTAVLAETPEIYGAQHLLTCRASDEKTAQDLLDRISWWEHYTKINDGSMDNNPSPGNKRGGLTTILEKSLGAVAKGGTTPFNGFYKYGEVIDRKGFVFMDSPGYDPASITGEIASGCNIVVFTTGLGSVFGSKPAPTVKVGSNSALFVRMPEDIDINAGSIVSDNRTVEAVGREIFDYILEVASGKQSKSESQGLGDFEFVPWQIGAVM